MEAIDRVIASGVCVGCGACAAIAPDRYSMEISEAGHWRASIKKANSKSGKIISHLCPMSGEAANESEIAAELFPSLPKDEQVGRYLGAFAAYVAEDDFRPSGGSGGITNWLLAQLLERGEIDAVIHVKPADRIKDDGLLFGYGISETVEQLKSGAKSRYYPIEMSGVLKLVQGSSKRFAFVGLPCFIKSIRLMQKEGLIPREQVVFCIGLVCGHLKSLYFAEYLSWQKGVSPGGLSSFDFRRKLMDRKASDYGFAYRRRGEEREEVWPMSSVKGRDWGEGMMKNLACEFCDDVIAECADIAIGDAWLPRYVSDPLGTNIVVTRNPMLHEIIQQGAASGAVVCEAVSLADVIDSQSSGLRHRREGLSHRLARVQESGAWIPQKRVAPRLAADPLRQKIYDARMKIAEKTALAFGDVRRSGLPIEQFEERIAPLLDEYHRAVQKERKNSRPSYARRILHRIKRLFTPLGD